MILPALSSTSKPYTIIHIKRHTYLIELSTAILHISLHILHTPIWHFLSQSVYLYGKHPIRNSFLTHIALEGISWETFNHSQPQHHDRTLFTLLHKYTHLLRCIFFDQKKIYHKEYWHKQHTHLTLKTNQ